MGDWTFFSNYGHVLVCLARNHQARLRDVARDVGITERAVQKIVRDMQDAGFLTVTKQGRCNRYRINRRKALRHSLESHCTVGRLLALVASAERSAPTAAVAETDDVTRPDGPSVVAPSPAPQPQAVPIAADAGDSDMDAGSAEPDPTAAFEADEAAAEHAPEPKTASEKERSKEPSPADTRQQGSLF